MGRIAIDLTGQVFGHLTVIGRGPAGPQGGSRPALWQCQCKCGNTRLARSDNLRNGKTKSCGRCGATYTSALTPETATWLLTTHTGSTFKSATNGLCLYSFQAMTNPVTGALAYSPKRPRFCANPAASAMVEAAENNAIGMRANRPTIHRWMVEERVVIAGSMSYESDLELIIAWERITGLSHPDRAWREHAAKMQRSGYEHVDAGNDPWMPPEMPNEGWDLSVASGPAAA